MDTETGMIINKANMIAGDKWEKAGWKMGWIGFYFGWISNSQFTWVEDALPGRCIKYAVNLQTGYNLTPDLTYQQNSTKQGPISRSLHIHNPWVNISVYLLIFSTFYYISPLSLDLSLTRDVISRNSDWLWYAQRLTERALGSCTK